MTTVWPSFQPSFLTYLTAVTKLQALLEPTNRPSLSMRNLAILTASASVILTDAKQSEKRKIISVNHSSTSFHLRPRDWEGSNRIQSERETTDSHNPSNGQAEGVRHVESPATGIVRNERMGGVEWRGGVRKNETFGF